MSENAVTSHLEALWGAPARTAHFTGPGHRIAVAKWDADQTDQGVTLYVTAGAGTRVCDPTTGRRVEFVLGLYPQYDDVAKSLAMLAGSVCSGIDVDRGHTVTLAEPFWPGSPFHTYMALPPIEDAVPPLGLPDGTHIEFLAVVPLYDSELELELELKKQTSAEWVTGELNDQEIPWWSAERPPLPG